MLAVSWLAPLGFTPVMAQGEAALPASDQSATAVVLDAVQPATDTPAPATTVNPTAVEELEGMKIAEPTKVPSGFGLWWQGLKEQVSIGLTFNPVKKAEKQLQFAEERMRLAELMAQKSEDQKVQARIHRVIGQAQKMMEKVEARRERFLEQKDEQAQRLLRNIATHEIRREAVMDKIEEKLPERAVEKFDKLRDRASNQGRRLLNAINNENAPAETREHLQAIKGRIEAHAEEIKSFRERRVELMEQAKAGGEEVKTEVKEQLKELRQDRLEKMQERREERKDERVENKQEKLENKLEDIKNGEAVKPLPANKPSAVIKMKALKQAAPVGGAIDQTVNSQL